MAYRASAAGSARRAARGRRRRADCPRVPGTLAPDLPRGLHDKAQLGPLVVLGQQIALHRGGKAALRAERQAVQGHVPRRLLDPGQQGALRLELRALAAHEPEHDGGPARDEPERRERSRSLVIVLEEKPVDLQAAEQLLRDRIVAALGVPVAAVVAAAEVL